MPPAPEQPVVPEAIAAQLQAELGGRWALRPLQAGVFATTWRADAAPPGRQRLFVKSLPLGATAAEDAGDGADRLEAEADGLAALAAQAAATASSQSRLAVPTVVRCCRDAAAGVAWLALEWLDLAAPDADFGCRFGAALGALHAAAPMAGGDRFGWRRDNYLGATPQRNRWRQDWVGFFANERLGALRDRLAVAGDAPLVGSVDRVIAALPRFFADGHHPRASLIHGDLWSGNWGMLGDGQPVVYDPAVACADAEAELAMMELFGAPPAGFWNAYRPAASLHPGYAARRGLYQLYHLLNHALLFGGRYGAQALALARALVR